MSAVIFSFRAVTDTLNKKHPLVELNGQNISQAVGSGQGEKGGMGICGTIDL
jgi:hypothetical protein